MKLHLNVTKAISCFKETRIRKKLICNSTPRGKKFWVDDFFCTSLKNNCHA